MYVWLKTSIKQVNDLKMTNYNKNRKCSTLTNFKIYRYFYLEKLFRVKNCF